MAGITGSKVSNPSAVASESLREIRKGGRGGDVDLGEDPRGDDGLAWAAGFGGLSLHRDIEGGGYALPEDMAGGDSGICEGMGGLGGGSGSRGGSGGLDGGIVGLDHGLLAAGFGLYAGLGEIGGGVVFMMVVCGGIGHEMINDDEGYGSDGTGEKRRSGIGYEMFKDDDDDGFIMNLVEIIVTISSFGFWRSDGAVNGFGWSLMWKKRKKQGEPTPLNSGRV